MSTFPSILLMSEKCWKQAVFSAFIVRLAVYNLDFECCLGKHVTTQEGILRALRENTYGSIVFTGI
jgi:hypothetical protein